MKPAPFRYFAPATLEEAIGLLSEHPAARPLAGGQSLIPAMNFRLARPEVLVDLGGISELRGIETAGDGGLRIGAMTSQRQVERQPAMREDRQVLHEAVCSIGHAPIRARGTIGGSIAHADPAAEIPAAILVNGGRLRLRGPDGVRSLPAEEFFLDLMTTAVGEAELLIAVELPPRPAGSGEAFIEVSRRPGDYALAGAAVRLVIDSDGTVADAKVALVAVGDKPALSSTAAELLRGREARSGLFAEAAEGVAAELDPPADIHASAEFRRHLARVLLERALGRAWRRATGSGP